MSLTENAYAYAIDRLIDNLDPRMHVATRAFFAQLKPEVADCIASFHRRYSKLMLELTFDLLKIRSRISRSLQDGPETNDLASRFVEGEFVNACKPLLRTVEPSCVVGYSEVEPLLAAVRAFRGDDKDSLYLEMYYMVFETCERLLSDSDFLNQQVIRQAKDSI